MAPERLLLGRESGRLRRLFALRDRVLVGGEPVAVIRDDLVADFLMGLRAGNLRIHASGDVCDLGNRIEPLRRRPRFNPGSAPVGAEDADRHVELLQQLAAEEEGRGAGSFEFGSRHRLIPFDRLLFGRGRAPLARHVRKAQQRQVRAVGNLLAGAVRVAVAVVFSAAPERHLHIGLAAGDPDFTDEDVFGVHAVCRARGLERAVLLAGGEGRELHHPLAVVSGGGRLRLIGELHRDAFAGGGEAPDRDFHIALQNRVVRKDRREFDFRFGCKPAQNERGGRKRSHPHASKHSCPPQFEYCFSVSPV